MIDSFKKWLLITYQFISGTRKNNGSIAMNRAEMLSAFTVAIIYLVGGGRQKLLGSYDIGQYSMMINVQITTEL